VAKSTDERKKAGKAGADDGKVETAPGDKRLKKLKDTSTSTSSRA
jgi:hypothetical protein